MQPSLSVCRRAAWALLFSLAGCVEPYVPAVINSPTTFLVVDGFINGNGRSTFLLSRTTNVATTTAPPAEPGASVAIVDDGGARYPLRETQPGTYQSDSLLLNASRQYQVRITTSANTDYESDPVPLKITPPLDQLSWQASGDELQILLDTHDPAGQARFYRWRFTETWEFNSAFRSFLEYRDGIVQYRTTPIYTCWRTEQNSLVKQGSTAQLSQDVIVKQPLLSVSNRAERLKIRYSVLVSQYAETAPEFAYNELLRKNTEAVGTVNDPLPSQLTGNVHRVDDTSEPVLGFVGAHTVQVKRLFINRPELNLPASWVFDTPYTTCVLNQELAPDPDDLFPVFIPYTKIFNNPDAIPVDYLTNDQGAKIGYIGTSAACVDCRTRGTNVKPAFW